MSHALGREQTLHRNFQHSPSPPSEELRDSAAPPEAMASSRDRSRSLSVAHDDEQPPSTPSLSASSRANVASPRTDAASPRPLASPPAMDLSRQLPHPSTSRFAAPRPTIPSLSTVTQLPPLRWEPRNGSRDLIESIEDLRELRHVLREERAQTIRRLEDLDYRVAAAETKIHQHLKQHDPQPASSSSQRDDSRSPRMLSPPTSPEEFPRSLTLPRLREQEPCRFHGEDEALRGSLDKIRLGVTPEPLLERRPPSVDYPPLRLPQIRPVADWTQDTASYAPSYQISYSRRSGSRSPSESPEEEPIVLPREHNVAYPSISRDNSVLGNVSRYIEGYDGPRLPLVQPHAAYRPFASPPYRHATREETPERRVFSPASVASSSSTLHKRDADHDASDSEDDEPLARVLGAPPAKRARLSPSPSPRSPPPAAAAPAMPVARSPPPIASSSSSSAHLPILPAPPPAAHQSTFTFVGTTVVPDPSRRRLVTKRQSRPGKIPCDFVPGPDDAACPMRFTRHADMVRHRESIHGAQAGKYRCPVCAKSLSRADAVKRHILGATDYIHADFVARRGREIDGGGDWWRSLVESDGADAAFPPPLPITS